MRHCKRRVWPGEQVIERQLGVGLAATEVGLQVDDAGGRGVSTSNPQCVEHVADQALERAGEVGALEEERGIAVLLRALVGDGTAQVDGEKRLGDGVLADIAMRRAGSTPSA